MKERVILRLTKKKIFNETTEKISPPKGTLFNIGSFLIKSYELSLDYLLIQKINYSDVYEYNGIVQLSPQPWSSYCEWHNGSLEEADDPTKRIYCPLEAEGFCSKHKRTDRAIYDLCLSYRGEIALQACKEIDKKIKGEYVVYLIDYGGEKPKVGTTRKFRILERIAEQPHIIATELFITDSLHKARLMEMNISKDGFANELWRHRWISTENIYSSIIKLNSILNNISKKYSLNTEFSFFRVKQPIKIAPKLLDYNYFYNKEFKIDSYWGGYNIIYLNNQPFILPENQMLHRDSLIIEKI
ncbi:MAG: hypothetical protein ACP5I6_00270 [Caldisphaera sp.]|jgi:hypothetical protein|nr:hypothetical protein [Caldisphaera sp.]PMP89836.1 MAG: hypothetical protein C0171_06315 [Caldisphaera sp.]